MIITWTLCDFLLYYIDRLHSTTKETSYKAMMNTWDNELIEKIWKNTIKKRLKAKTVHEINLDVNYVRVSNCITIIGKEHVFYHSLK